MICLVTCSPHTGYFFAIAVANRTLFIVSRTVKFLLLCYSDVHFKILSSRLMSTYTNVLIYRTVILSVAFIWVSVTHECLSISFFFARNEGICINLRHCSNTLLQQCESRSLVEHLQKREQGSLLECNVAALSLLEHVTIIMRTHTIVGAHCNNASPRIKFLTLILLFNFLS
jgi:hypothetical protein